jgi:hypothetical protein
VFIDDVGWLLWLFKKLKIITSSLSWVRLLVEDTGGHGHALLETLTNFRVDFSSKGETFNGKREYSFFESLSEDFRARLVEKYPSWPIEGEWLPLFECAIARKPFFNLTHQKCSNYSRVVHGRGCNKPWLGHLDPRITTQCAFCPLLTSFRGSSPPNFPTELPSISSSKCCF